MGLRLARNLRHSRFGVQHFEVSTTLEAVHPFAGHLPDLGDRIYFVTHPCHPPIFSNETEMVAR